MRGSEPILNYITNYILKKGEELSKPVPTRTESEVEASLHELHIIRKTVRTFRHTGTLILALDFPEETAESRGETGYSEHTLAPPILQGWTPGKRVDMDEAEAFDLMQQGWVIKEIRLKRDGKTVERAHYRMGYRLFNDMERQILCDQQVQSAELEKYQLRAGNLMELYKNNQTGRATELFKLVLLLNVSLQWNVAKLLESEHFPARWNLEKRIKGLHFIRAITEIALSAPVFDWKEVGSRYYGAIGGSKAFDIHREEFLSWLEHNSGTSAELLGMISPGRITPMYFAGDLEGQWSTYKAGPVHALTDLSIAQDHYKTNAEILWLVENRAVLTRMAAEPDFVEQTNSLIVCVDGHMRSSHRTFIQRLLEEDRSIKQAILWSDYDADGLLITGEMSAALAGHELVLKFIAHDHQVYQDHAAFKAYMDLLLTTTHLEQEQVLGKREEWSRWINL
ncbi:DUF2399 domain-containing protein [Paenibacillus sp. PAMC 26794]|uniref:DUF2399 domain-containing protein n=1 Tax=Paenibacillus sp. PAMC 26794 TaxID=1257080 RepID=UPI00031F81AE|nr:DUF2399 domain-containing protein [Paenibacillus sp. PAMC 26794]